MINTIKDENMDINYWLLITYVIIIVANFIYGVSGYEYRIICTQCKLQIKLSSILSLILLFFLIFLVVRDRDNPDIHNYYSSYEGTEIFIRKKEMGFELLITIAKKIGLDFYQFRAIIYVFSGLSIWFFFTKMGLDKNIAFSMYAFYPFVYDGIQIRNFLAFVIILLFLPSYFSGTKKGIFLYVVGVLISFSIHFIGILYLIFILINFNSKKIIRKRQKILIFSFVLSMLLIIFMKILPSISLKMMNILISQLDGARIRNYFDHSGNQWGFVIFLFLELMFVYISKKCRDSLYKNTTKQGVIMYRLAENIFWINVAICCLSPLLIANVSFYRLFRNILLINYCIPSIAIAGRIWKKSLCFIFIFAFLANAIWSYMTDSIYVFLVFFN